MNQISCLLLCLLLIHSSSSLRCYKCNTTDHGCRFFTTEIATEPCGNPTGNNLNHGCMTKMIKDENGTVSITRSCVGLDGTQCQVSKGISSVYCNTCYGDRCNTAIVSGSVPLKHFRYFKFIILTLIFL